jgi:Tol biopolymer transport system component/DNA-binding winged helix-turn-helix (wHTH) protein
VEDDLMGEARWGELQIGEWVVAPSLNRLWDAGGRQVSVEPRVMQVLVRLAADPGRVLSRDELVSSIWPGPHVSDDAVSRCISALRRALGDDPAAPRYLETIRKGGYRLLAPVRVLAPEAGAETTSAETTSPPALPAPPAGAGWRPALPRAAGLALGAVALLAVAMASGLRIGAGSSRVEPAAPRLRPATSLAGSEVDPALSPRGVSLAFSWSGPAGDNFDIYVKSVDASAHLRLTDHPGEDKNPVWSPDGEWLGFIRAGTAADDGIYVVPAFGGTPQRLATTRMADSPDLSWSGDGRWLVFADRAANGEPSAIFRVERATGRRERLTTPPPTVAGDRDLALSPDGHRLAFARAEMPGVEELWMVEVTEATVAGGGHARRLTADGASINGIEWSSDGERLLFSSSRDGTSRLWWTATDGTGLQSARDLGEGALDPSLAGSRLAFERKVYDTNVWRLELERQAPPRPVAVSTRWDHAPAIAPDGVRAAFVTDRAGPSEVWLADAAGSWARRLIASSAPLLGRLAWTPDGRHVVVAHPARQATDLLVVDVERGTGRPLRTGGTAIEPAVGHDGRFVYFASDRGGRWQIWRLPLSGGAAVQVTRTGGTAARESADGRRLFFSRRDANGLWQRDEAGAETLVAGTGGLRPGFDWDLGRDAVFFRPLAAEPTRSQSILRLRFGSALLEAVSPPLSGLYLPGLGLTVSPDQRFLLFGRADRNDSDLVIAEPVTWPR